MTEHTKADKERFRRLSGDGPHSMGCIACRSHNGSWVLGEVAHVTDRGRRVGHQATIPLCPWHHRGVVPEGVSEKTIEKDYGPSFAKGKSTFCAYFGSEAELLEKTNAWLGIKK